jgi:hypothetical protein
MFLERSELTKWSGSASLTLGRKEGTNGNLDH